MTTKGTAMIPETHAERQDANARILVLISGQFPVKAFRKLARLHAAETRTDPGNKKAIISVPYGHDRLESVMHVLESASVKITREHTSLKLIADAERKAAHYQSVVC